MTAAERNSNLTPRGAMRWPLGLHIAVVLVLAVAAVITVLGLLWLMLGAPQVQVSGPLRPGDTYDAIKIALAVVAGVGGVVALVVAYRRQHLSEATDLREYDKALIERFGAAAEQLGTDQPAVRMAGAYAMARLADEWPQERQMCIDVLCGYLRMPHAPDPPTDDQALASWQREREVRVTVLRLIAAHLRDGAPTSWQGHDLDFTGAVLVEADFRGARFTGGDILFVKALFAGDGTEQIIFDEANFAEDSHVYFRLAEFRSGTVRFNRATFSGGWVTFDHARFTGGRVTFRDAAFTAGEVSFEGAEFSDGIVDFTGATFTGSAVNFGERHLSSIYRTVPPAHFSGGTVDLSQVADLRHPPKFGLQVTPSGLRLPSGTSISDLP
ncbi:pentapeptide repeat-containing protein [Streptomyces europaeiscabiei]|uniref:pentapeptide repeat-containing protein n=1 Tax=Streptomyces europaeiscabiei TaxID=146819 RepID=UPI0029A97EE1|nr:pentapeptide repeat-containing protein [Streptomyces europaeiscabiei]MDX2531297.1 pentapeptide repeat-containing protein [Streptomyces europaeiscabiei]